MSMTKEEMRAGFALGRTMVQEEWADPAEIKAVDELIAEGVAEVIAPWQYMDNFQCERRKVCGRVRLS